jgi:hypothetical protein
MLVINNLAVFDAAFIAVPRQKRKIWLGVTTIQGQAESLRLGDTGWDSNRSFFGVVSEADSLNDANSAVSARETIKRQTDAPRISDSY